MFNTSPGNSSVQSRLRLSLKSFSADTTLPYNSLLLCLTPTHPARHSSALLLPVKYFLNSSNHLDRHTGSFFGFLLLCDKYHRLSLKQHSAIILDFHRSEVQVCMAAFSAHDVHKAEIKVSSNYVFIWSHY